MSRLSPWRRLDKDAPPGERCCLDCSTEAGSAVFHPLDQFYTRPNRTGGISYSPSCKTKTSAAANARQQGNRPKHLAYCKEWMSNHSAHRQDYRRAWGFGLPRGTYSTLVQRQKARCAVCKQKPTGRRSLCLDHNHETGEVRGLVCDKCNRAIGLLDDDVRRARALARYLNGTHTGIIVTINRDTGWSRKEDKSELAG